MGIADRWATAAADRLTSSLSSLSSAHRADQPHSLTRPSPPLPARTRAVVITSSFHAHAQAVRQHGK